MVGLQALLLAVRLAPPDALRGINIGFPLAFKSPTCSWAAAKAFNEANRAASRPWSTVGLYPSNVFLMRLWGFAHAKRALFSVSCAHLKKIKSFFRLEAKRRHESRGVHESPYIDTAQPSGSYSGGSFSQVRSGSTNICSASPKDMHSNSCIALTIGP